LFSKTFTLCELKEILQEDKGNYMAYILLGAAYQNVDKTQAAKYLREAIQYSDGPATIAYQGLSSCARIEELPDIYEQLLNLVP